MEILSGKQMQSVDGHAIDTLGIPSLELMEAAGRGVAEALLRDYPTADACPVVVLCGKGNNGGDGLVVARHLARRGIRPRVLVFGAADQLKADAAVNLEAARGSGLEVTEVTDAEAWSRYSSCLEPGALVVDALLGTGVRGGARGLVARVIDDVNRADVHIASVDLPSGLDADTNRVEGRALRAERTYTLCRPKLALTLEPAALHAGEWRVVAIGIPDGSVAQANATCEWLDADVAARLLPAREPESHKGHYGHLLAVAGSRGKSGAAVLLARGALRSGVGLITVATPVSIQSRVASQQAEVMTEGLPETKTGVASRLAAKPALDLAASLDALALGPGLGTEAGTRAMVATLVAERRVPCVLDADGLNSFAEAGDSAKIPPLEAGSLPLVLTPHPGEAARLLGWSASRVQVERLEAATSLARRTGATVVLKGHRTLVSTPEGKVSINSTGNPGMATAGSGDVLTGVLGAFLARGLSGRDAARLAVYVHGAAGDRAAAALGQDGLIASDLIDELPRALLALRRLREDIL